MGPKKVTKMMKVWILRKREVRGPLSPRALLRPLFSPTWDPPGALIPPMTSSLLAPPLLVEPGGPNLEPQRLPLLPSLKHQAWLVPFLTHRTAWGCGNLTRPPGLESRVLIWDSRSKAFPFHSPGVAVAKHGCCAYTLLQWPPPSRLRQQQHLCCSDPAARELEAVSQMPSTLYVAFPCPKYRPILSLGAFLLQDPNQPKCHLLGEGRSSPPCRSVCLIGLCWVRML